MIVATKYFCYFFACEYKNLVETIVKFCGTRAFFAACSYVYKKNSQCCYGAMKPNGSFNHSISFYRPQQQYSSSWGNYIWRHTNCTLRNIKTVAIKTIQMGIKQQQFLMQYPLNSSWHNFSSKHREYSCNNHDSFLRVRTRSFFFWFEVNHHVESIWLSFFS